MAITGATRCTLKELDAESVHHKRWFQNLWTLFLHIFQSPHYLYKLLPLQTSSCITRSFNNTPYFHFHYNFFKIFFPSAIIKWNNLHSVTQYFCHFLRFRARLIRNLKSNIINFLYELDHELPNGLRPRISEIRKRKGNLKTGWGYKLVSSLPSPPSHPPPTPPPKKK